MGGLQGLAHLCVSGYRGGHCWVHRSHSHPHPGGSSKEQWLSPQLFVCPCGPLWRVQLVHPGDCGSGWPYERAQGRCMEPTLLLWRDTGLRGGPWTGSPALPLNLGSRCRGFWCLWPLLPRPLSSCSLSVIPQVPHRKGGLALWQGCTQPGRVLACPSSTLLSQLKKTFLHRVRGKYPGQLEIGSVLLACSLPQESGCYN